MSTPEAGVKGSDNTSKYDANSNDDIPPVGSPGKEDNIAELPRREKQRRNSVYNCNIGEIDIPIDDFSSVKQELKMEPSWSEKPIVTTKNTRRYSTSDVGSFPQIPQNFKRKMSDIELL